MDHQEEQNTEQVDEALTPEETPSEKASQDQTDSPEAVEADSAADDQPQQPPAINNAKPGQLPDDAGQLKTLVKERDKVIVDLRTRNKELQQKLNEKEKVVTALTSRLEQAAEQLDRLRRSGADRGGKILSGIPAEVIDEQRELINDLKAAIETWEDLQSTSAMGRFESQLNELREMLAEQMDLKDRIDKGETTTTGFKSSSTPPVAQRSSWDEMKAQLLGDSSAAAKTPKDDSDVLIPGAVPGEDETDEEELDGKAKFEEKFESEFAIDIPERPAEVDNLDEADADTLRAALKERDEHIDKLMEVIDALKEFSGQHDLDETRKRQKELHDRLQKAESEMKEKLRQAEIEMSMERAKLAREAARLQQLSAGDGDNTPRDKNGAEENSEEAGGEDKGSRWARFLGSK
jgi:hypothetical protein